MKGFEPHFMYDKKKANTHKEHVKLKQKGYSHSPLLKKDCNCWDGWKRKKGTKPCAENSCVEK